MMHECARTASGFCGVRVFAHHFLGCMEDHRGSGSALASKQRANPDSACTHLSRSTDGGVTSVWQKGGRSIETMLVRKRNNGKGKEEQDRRTIISAT